MVLSTFPLHVQDRQTALTTASRSGHDHIVEELLRRDANVNHQEEVRILKLCLFVQYDIRVLRTVRLASHFPSAVHSEVYYVHCWLHCIQILCQCCTSQLKVVDCTHVCWCMYIPSYSRIAYKIWQHSVYKLDAAMACWTRADGFDGKLAKYSVFIGW